MNKENPVAWFSTSPDGKLSNKFACKPTEGNWVEPLYTAPQKKEWVGLTDDVVFELADTNLYEGGKNFGVLAFARALEQALKEKNHG